MNAGKLIGFLAGNFLLYFSSDNSIPMGDSPSQVRSTLDGVSLLPRVAFDASYS
jgi:hypothetical protein